VQDSEIQLLKNDLPSIPKLVDKLQVYAAIRPGTGWELQVREGHIRVALTELGKKQLDQLIADNSVLSPELAKLREELND
jgi:hypothetical protein